MTPLAAYVLLFLAVGVGFIFVHLVIGKLIRPSKKTPEKDTIYECGEPTIGSAWIQFDLRFYVVALLFVIFDVEVAFFFPWAEVFGKANDIRGTPAPKTAQEHNAFATKVLDLSAPAGGKASDRQFWERVKFLTERPQATEEQTAPLKQLVAKIKEEQEAEAKRLEAAVVKLPESAQQQIQRVHGPAALGMGPMPQMFPGPVMLRRSLDDRVNEVNDVLHGTSFGKLRQVKIEDVELVYRPTVANLLAKLMPQDIEAARALSRRHVDEVRAAAATVIDAGGPGERALREGVTLNLVNGFGTVKVNDARSAADNLAWLAFFEILVFFGVLLVGFAYLWRRGDLAWVRSTAAETVVPVSAKVATRELETVGKGS